MLLSEKSGKLRYTNNYMSNFNNQTLPGTNGVPTSLTNLEKYPIRQQLTIINDFLRSQNKNAKTAFVGKDGQIKIRPTIGNDVHDMWQYDD